MAAEPVLRGSYSAESASWLTRFDWSLQAAHRSRATRRIYGAVLRRWALHVPDLLNPAKAGLDAWLRDRRATTAAATMQQELVALRAFYRWAHAMGCTAVDHSTMLPAGPRVPQRLPRYLTDDQVGQLLAAPNLATLVGFRDHVLIRLAYETGMRAGELVALQLGSVRDDRTIVILAGKGNVDRLVPISAAMLELLEAWVRLRQTTRPGKANALFVTHRGKALRSARSVWEIVTRYTRPALGLARAFDRIRAERKQRPWQGQYPHLLRASFATALLQRGCDLRAIQELLGHADVRTTARYLTVDLAMLKREHAKLPRARRAPAAGDR